MSTDGFEEMCPNCVTPWKCNGPHEFPPAAPEPTADTAAEPEAGWPVWWNGGWCNENGTGRYAPLDVDSGEPWPIWSDMPGAVPAAVPSPEPPAAACANCDLDPTCEVLCKCGHAYSRHFPEFSGACKDCLQRCEWFDPSYVSEAPNTHQRMSNEILAEGAARLDAEWEVEFARIIGEKRNTVRFKRIAKDTRALIVDRMAGPSPAASQEPGETR